VFDWKDRIDISMHGNQEAKLRAEAEEADEKAKGRIEHCEVSCPHLGCNPDVAPQIVPKV
jgi:hypothetical protein